MLRGAAAVKMKLPPFAKQLNPGAREIWIYCGSNPWRAAKFRSARKLPVLLLPPDKQPDQFRWPVSGKEVLMIQQGDFEVQKIPAFANLLFGYGAAVVRAVYGDGLVVCYKGKFNARAA